MPDDPWRTSVTELVLAFREALRAMVEPLERAHIRWKEPDSYDQWDAIAQTLWTQIVIDAVNYGINEHELLNVPKYGSVYDDYAKFSFVEVRPKVPFDGSHLAIVDLRNDDSRFNTARVLRLDQGSAAGAMELFPVDESDFVFRHRQPNGSLIDVAELAIDE